MRARSPLAPHLAAALTLIACAAPPPLTTPAKGPSATPPTAPTLDPCTRAATARARVPALLEAGRLDRAVRVIEHADALCPDTAAVSMAAHVGALAALGRIEDARAAAAVIDRDPRAPAEARAAAASAREAKPGTDSAEALLDAAFATRVKGGAAEAQRLFDRAAVHIERDAGAKLTLQVQNGLEASAGLPWKGNGGIFPRSMGTIVPMTTLSHDGKRAAIPDGKRVLVLDRDKGRLRLRLEGHEANITSIAWSADDKLLATGSYDGTARVWDTASGKSKLAVSPADYVREVRFLRQGTVLGCVHDDASAWDVASGRPLGRATGGTVSAASIDPDGVVTMTDNGTPKQRYDLFTGARLADPVPRATAFTPDESIGAAAFGDRLEIRQYPGGKLVRTLPLKGAAKGAVQRLWISRDGKRLAAGEEDEDSGPIRRIKAWDLKTGRLLGTLVVDGDQGYGISVADVTADGKLALPHGDELRVVDPKSGKVVRSLPDPDRIKPGMIKGLAGEDGLTPDAITLAGDGATAALMLHQEVGEEWPSRLVVLDLRARTLRDLEGAGPSNELRLLPGGKLLSWHYNDVKTWDPASGKPTTILDGGSKGFGILHVSDDGRLAVVQAPHDERLVIDLGTGERIHGEQPGHRSFLGAVPGGGLFLMEKGGRLSILDTRTGKIRVLAEPPGGKWIHAAASRDGRWALLVEQESPSRYFLHTAALAGGAPQRIETALETIELLGAIGDRGLLVSTKAAGTPAAAEVQLLDAEKGTPIRTIRSDLWEVIDVTTTRDDRVLAAVSRPEALVGFWSLDDGAPLAALRVLAKRKTAYVITADGALEVFGDAADVLDDHGYCLAGAHIYPVEVCQERHVATGILRGILTHDTSWRDP